MGIHHVEAMGQLEGRAVRYFPVSWRVEGRSVTIIGGGEIAERRVAALLDCGARVRVIAPEASGRIRSLAEEGRVTLISRDYRPGDLDGAWAVLTATSDPEVNEAAWTEASGAGIPINVADDPERCDFILPALVRRGDLSIAISTEGSSPALAARLRQRLSGWIGPEYGHLLQVLKSVRSRLKHRVANPEERKRIHYRLVDSDLLALIRRGDASAIEERVDEIVSGFSGVDPAAGIVYIVGAGPGDPGLMTLRGLECLRAADVVLHDRLIDSRLLDQARAESEIIDVGKRSGDGGRMQEFIQETMVDRARRGQTVCRLKGGDPFVFGRGGEEARALTEARVPFEIVPGVTSAIAAPAAAGIPLTHRDIAHCFMVMTGSRAERARPGEWLGARSLIADGGTLVVLMGLSRIETIVKRLREAGCPADTPAAVISRGTCEDQQVAVGTLDDLTGSTKRVVSPAVIVFGEVVRERQRLSELGRVSPSWTVRPRSPE